MKKWITLLSIILIAIVVGCDGPKREPKPVDRLAQLAQEAAQEAAAATIDPWEIKMIEYRRGVMGRPGLQMYVAFLNAAGQPIEYFVTNGKCSSSNKRLTNGTDLVKGDKGTRWGTFAVPAAGEDGTHGPSDEYIYCRTVDDKYKQWNGEYLMMDAPFELYIKPLVIDYVEEGETGIQSQH